MCMCVCNKLQCYVCVHSHHNDITNESYISDITIHYITDGGSRFQLASHSVGVRCRRA